MQVLNLVREVQAAAVQEEPTQEELEYQAQPTQEAVVVEVLELGRLWVAALVVVVL